jgi:hypothetical protein
MATGSNILTEYLVKLGFTQDTVAFSQFQRALREVNSLVDNQFGQMATKILQFQTASVAAFAAVGAAAIGIVDKTAMADQEYRLLALHMYTSLPVARELKIALDALGQPLENIMWDPELAARFNQLVKDQRALTQELGPDFENQMLKIRDVRFEFTRFGVELEYLTMKVVQNLAQAFGLTVDDMLGRMRKFNDWFVANMPQIAEWISSRLVPVLQDVWRVLTATGEVVKEALVGFTMLIGILSDNKALQSTEFSFTNLTKAIQTSVGWLATFLEVLAKIEKNILLLFSAANQAVHGQYGAAMGELRKMTPIGLPDYGTQGVPLSGAGPKLTSQSTVQSAVIAAAHQYGVSPELALAVAQQESGYKQFDRNGKIITSNKGALGVMQLMPDTARRLGVDPRDTGQNIQGGVKLLAQLLRANAGNEEWALRQYNAGTGRAQWSAQAKKYAQDVMKIESGVNIGNLHINVPQNNMTKEGIADAVKKGIEDAAKNRVQRNIGEFQVPGWSY